MPIYRRKSWTVEAMQLTEKNGQEVATWCGGVYVKDPKASDPTDVAHFVRVPAIGGEFRLSRLEYLVKGTDGRFSKLSSGSFEHDFEPVTTRRSPRQVGVKDPLGSDYDDIEG